MSLVGSIVDEGKRATKKAKEKWKEVTPAGQARGLVRDVRTARIQAEKAQKVQKEALARQKQKALLEQAMLGNEIALRSRVAQKGGRRSLLTGGETGYGSLLV